MTLFIIAGVVCLLASLTITSVVISALNMGDRNQALGLPRGSVRALIALSLIIVFAMTSLSLFRELQGNRTKDEEGNWILIEPSEESVRFAQQILTTVSTLVVAVSSFYFGSRSVEVARRAVETPNLRVISPTSPAKLVKDEGKELPIKVEATPENEPINWDIKKDDKGSLVQVKPYEFIYTRGPSPEDIVTLTFKLRNYPDVTAELEVKALELSVSKPEAKPAKLAKTKGTTLQIEIETKPKPDDQPVEGSIVGDDEESLKPKESGKFKEWVYTRGPSPEDIVTLTFKLRNYPDVTAELKVEKPEDVE